LSGQSISVGISKPQLKYVNHFVVGKLVKKWLSKLAVSLTGNKLAGFNCLKTLEKELAIIVFLLPE
jgi:hypothetical protein